MDDDVNRVLDQILGALRRLEDRVGKLEGGGAPAVSTGAQVATRKSTSIKEFIIDRAPSNGVLLTLTVGFYLENFDRVSPFTAADLEAGFRAAREQVPANLNDKANNCVKRGYFMESKDKKDSLKAWLITATGERAVKEGFS